MKKTLNNINFTNKRKKLLDVLTKYYGQIIIYVSTRKTKELNEYIKLNKISCTYYVPVCPIEKNQIS